MEYVFRKARMDEVADVFSIIEARVRWMDACGIRQWNVTDYLNAYPLAYYQGHIDSLYVLADEGTGRILSAAMLFETDKRWSAIAPAFYIHNFVSDVSVPGSGRIFMNKAEALAAKTGKQYLRLDSASDNAELTAYYASLGFEECGYCRDGAYSGILRQKNVTL